MKRNDSRQYHLYCSADKLDRFQRVYPDCLRRFLINAIEIALSDYDFFQKVFFKDLNYEN